MSITNGCENFWSLLKRALEGADRFVLRLRGIVNKRLIHKAIIGSEVPETC